MKNKYSFCVITFLLLWNLHSYAQQTLPHQAELPPQNPGYSFTRGMYVDCADKIIYEISAGETFRLQKDLYDYIRKNYMGYIILCGLEHSNIFGNRTLESALQSFMIKTRKTFPGIKIGLSGNDAGVFQNTAPLTVSPPFDLDCLPYGTLITEGNFKDALNDAGLNSVNIKKSELCKFFYRAAQFGNYNGVYKYSTHCSFAFDSFYLEYRYWNETSSLGAMQNEFLNFKTILSVMKVLKCNYSCIRNIDAEFLPTEIFNLQAWTAIDQITEADPLADRLMIPSFTNNAAVVYDNICKNLHFLSDRFSKSNSNLFLKLSAESNTYNYCNSTDMPQNYLGNYLDGSATPSGNMYSVEKMFLDKFNDPNYMCSSCSCRPYNDNHYSISNSSGNSMIGVMWGPFSMLKKHNLFKEALGVDSKMQKGDPVLVQLIDFSGRILKTFRTLEESNELDSDASLSDGIYLLKIVYENKQQEVRKIARFYK